MNIPIRTKDIQHIFSEARAQLVSDCGFTYEEVEELIENSTLRIARVGLSNPRHKPSLELVVRHPRFKELGYTEPRKSFEWRLEFAKNGRRGKCYIVSNRLGRKTK